jgi:ABC-type glycerol-3-phosphate transport system substrate-binding protein
MYRKISEKSRYWDAKRPDHFIFFAAIVLLVAYAAVNLFFKSAAASRRIELLVTPQCEELFGRDTVAALIREFEERNPGLRISLKDPGAEGTGRRYSPDIVFFDESRFSALVRQEALLSLNSYIRTETMPDLRAIPLVSFMDLLFYNIDILRAAGFDRPPKTRAEFLACAKAVSGLQTGTGESGTADVYGAALSLSPDDPLSPRRDVFSWIWAGGAVLQPVAGATGAAGPYFGGAAAVAIIAFLGELNREGALAPGTFVKTGTDRLDDFAHGKIAMMIASSKDIQRLRKEMGGSVFGVTNIPGSPSTGKSNVALSAIYAGISAGSDRPDEAWTFLSFLAEKGPVLAEKLGAVPGSLPGLFPGGVLSGDYINADSYYSKVRDIFEAAETIQGFSGNPRAEELERAVREELRVFFEQDRSPALTAAAIQKRWDSL